jgi:MoaA/NifB/PqqE/SkfB family radical SAM enzyme
MKVTKSDKYVIIFDNKRGIEFTYGINGNPDPFVLDFPSLIDIGIMQDCKNNCKICYQGNKVGPNMTIDDYKFIIDQCKDFTNQVALGGRGDPNLHPNFEEILKYSRDNNIVPNYTTSGINLTDEQIKITKKYVGACAVSMYNKDFTFSAINRLINSDVKTNIHWIVSKETISDITKFLSGIDIWDKKFPIHKVNAFIFLLFKPQGNGLNFKDLALSENEIQKVIDCMRKSKGFKIGVDSCLFNNFKNLTENEILFGDSCESSRMGAYIDSQLNMKPCSFMDDVVSISIRNTLIREVWLNSEIFISTRNKLKNNKICCPALE